MGTTLLAVISLITRHYYKVIWVNQYFYSGSDTHIYVQFQEMIMDPLSLNRRKAKQLITKTFLIEILILLISPIPFYDWYIPIRAKSYHVVYFVSEFLFAFMFLRIFFLVRAVFNYSVYTNAHSKKLCQTYGFSAGVRFTLKC